jgi:homoaconitate hydratase
MKRFLGNPAGAAHCCSVAGSSPLPRTGMRSPALRLHTSAAAWQRPQNLIEKIVQKYTVDSAGREVQSLDFVTIRPRHVMTHDNTSAVIKKFKSIAASVKDREVRVANPRQPVFTLDHNIQDRSEANLNKYKQIQEFAEKYGIDAYPAGRGIGHQVMCEEGYAFPGTMVVASDSHSNMYGGLGCLGTPIVRTDAAAIWATGATWWQIPPVARVELRGQLPEYATGKDIIITLCGLFNKDEVLNHAVEFVGEGVDRLTIDDRLTIANMTTEWGALAGVFPIDDRTIGWLRDRESYIASAWAQRKPIASDVDGHGKHPRINPRTIKELEDNVLEADRSAFYAKELVLDLSTVRPHVSGPNHVKVMHSVDDMERKGIKVNKAYIVSCTNSRVQDLSAAANVLRGKKVAEGVELYIAAASSEVENDSAKRGDWQALIDAGATPLPPGCGPCIGLGAGLLQAGEVGISATNRNFKGRMGSREADVYLASPEVVAASALAGVIKAPGGSGGNGLSAQGSVKVNSKDAHGSGEGETVAILPGFVERLEGELVFCNQDNINTDGIYPGKYTYNEDISPQQQAEVSMENYDPTFTKKARKGDLLVSGYNFGTGSSREQAATCLKHYGISLVLAGSFSETYKRNAFNNGYLVIEVPELVDYLKEKASSKEERELTQRTGLKAVLDFKSSTLNVDGRKFAFPPVGAVAQEIVLAGGLEQWVEKKL